MSDFPVLNLNTAPEQARPVLEATQAASGFIPNLLDDAFKAHAWKPAQGSADFG